ncbi:sugar 1-4-lactone oxidase [Apiospora marii]|uniref:sugar 1-4-lactone oxidase n=1 Tax=Apiospora marii TaxID=335849 RepID=UPI0031319ABD
MAPSSSSPTALDSQIQAIIDDAVGKSGVPFRARRAYTHATWAKTFSSRPELYLEPETQEEVEQVVRLARLCRRRLVPVGHAHSPSTLTCTSNWMLSLDKMNRILAFDDATGVATMQAGIRLFQLSDELARRGFAMPIMGSVNEQSIAGVISTGTRGSSLKHGLLSESITSLKITLGSGQTAECSATEDPDLFRAALLSLGALGIITEVTFRAVPAFALRWDQRIDTDARVLATWDTTLWTQADFVRVWWLPYTRRAVLWKADAVPQADLDSGRERLRDPPVGYYDGALGYHIYHNLLALARWVPRIVPWIEWFVFGLQYGFRNGEATRTSAVQPSAKAFWMNCLYSQYVTEWAIPLARGPEALARLGAWLNRLQPGDPGYVNHGIPFSAEGVYVHSPVEVRVCDGRARTPSAARPWLDSTVKDGPTLNINATMYRPYLRDPPGLDRWFAGFEWLMRDLGGRPHWAKNFGVSAEQLADWYGDDLTQWRRVRDKADPDGLFVGPWHRQHVLDPAAPRYPAEERETGRVSAGAQTGVTVLGDVQSVKAGEAAVHSRQDSGVSAVQ